MENLTDINAEFYLASAVKLLNEAIYKWQMASLNIQLAKENMNYFSPYELRDTKILDRPFELKNDVRQVEQWLGRIKRNATA